MPSNLIWYAKDYATVTEVLGILLVTNERASLSGISIQIPMINTVANAWTDLSNVYSKQRQTFLQNFLLNNTVHSKYPGL